MQEIACSFSVHDLTQAAVVSVPGDDSVCNTASLRALRYCQRIELLHAGQNMQAAKASGALDLEKLLDMKEAGIDVESFVSEEMRLQMYQKEVGIFSLLQASLLAGRSHNDRGDQSPALHCLF